MQLPAISAGWIVSLAIAIAFDILFPFALGIFLASRLKTGWRYFWFGALVFVVFQLITRVPAVFVIQSLIAEQLKASPSLQVVWLVALALTAGLFEEVGRYVGYRVFMRREEKTWNKAILYGAGHGGIESILLVGGFGLASLVNVLALPNINLSTLPPDQQRLIVQQFTALAAQPAWLPLLGAYERLGAIVFHIAMSVVVLQVFRRSQIRWLWIAVFAHFLFDLTAVGITFIPGLDPVTKALASEGVVTIAALIALRLIFVLRDKPASGAPQARQADMPQITPPSVG